MRDCMPLEGVEGARVQIEIYGYWGRAPARTGHEVPRLTLLHVIWGCLTIAGGRCGADGVSPEGGHTQYGQWAGRGGAQSHQGVRWIAKARPWGEEFTSRRGRGPRTTHDTIGKRGVYSRPPYIRQAPLLTGPVASSGR